MLPSVLPVLRPVLYMLLAAACLLPGAHAGEPAWTQDQVSSALSGSGQPAISSFQVPQDMADSVPASARITRVYAARDYSGSALVDTSLCWGSVRGPCVSLPGRHLNSHVFDGLAASGPLLLVHRLRHPQAATGPLYIRGTVTVWYADPGL